MNSKTFSKRVNETLEEVIKEAVLADDYRPSEDKEHTIKVNDTLIFLYNPEKITIGRFKFICKFDPTKSKPKDIAKFVLFGLTQNHVIEIEINNRKRFFKIDDVKFMSDIMMMYPPAHVLEVFVDEVVGLETGSLPNGQKVYSPIIPENNQ